mmetsp:Transcript_25930/g.59925  ORF Transcript_25930/g.59925 Transcript_25930/m.59925 type:complete len:298 (-) Transcript_25930:547-1440(-)
MRRPNGSKSSLCSTVSSSSSASLPCGSVKSTSTCGCASPVTYSPWRCGLQIISRRCATLRLCPSNVGSSAIAAAMSFSSASMEAWYSAISTTTSSSSAPDAVMGSRNFLFTAFLLSSLNWKVAWIFSSSSLRSTCFLMKLAFSASACSIKGLISLCRKRILLSWIVSTTASFGSLPPTSMCSNAASKVRARFCSTSNHFLSKPFLSSVSAISFVNCCTSNGTGGSLERASSRARTSISFAFKACRYCRLSSSSASFRASIVWYSAAYFTWSFSRSCSSCACFTCSAIFDPMSCILER